MRAFLFFASSITLVAIAALGCSSNSSQSPGGACSWPSDLDAPSGNCPSWTVARYLNECQVGANSEVCLSSDSTCPPDPTVVGGSSPTNCTDQCKADEYVVAAGGLPQTGECADSSEPPSLPSGCHFAFATPAGVSYECCPCQ